MRRMIAVGLIFAFGCLFIYLSAKAPTEIPQLAEAASVTINSTEIEVELARTGAEIEKGLSGRASLHPDKGLLFLFSYDGIYRFWMPDMNFPIDIIWISADKEVVAISADVSNEFDPADPDFYSPPEPVRYVLEVNAGFAARNGIKAGDSVVFSGI